MPYKSNSTSDCEEVTMNQSRLSLEKAVNQSDNTRTLNANQYSTTELKANK